MENLNVNIENILNFTPKYTINNYDNEICKNISLLHNRTGKGNNSLGWLDLPSSISDEQIKEINNLATEIKDKIDILVIIGIGGSYLGAKMVIEALSNNFEHLQEKKSNPIILFAGQNICEDYISELLAILEDKSYAIVVISKSGTTTEPAIAFRFLKKHIENKYGKSEAQKRIIAVTDETKGALRKLADNEGYKTFIIPDDVGGRYSVLTPVGLVPIALAGFNIKKLIDGAKLMQNITKNEKDIYKNPAAIYAVSRNALYNINKTTEILVTYNPKLVYLAEWWKQLYGESEGKENKGIFPASVNFTADLHSMGQYIQEGLRNIFETVITIEKPKYKLTILQDPENLDNLNYLTGKRINEVNKMAELGTVMAHVDGGVPNIKIEIPEINEFYIGQLIYFFEKACAISGYTLDINPFDQPGVEAYKKNMFTLLKKPGY
ncbi:MAG: glucose-6-phosphate isomerase [Bacteroidales bacterium]|nr:glucose-6-phosphate isomerase [Bacteroidales bacterium]